MTLYAQWVDLRLQAVDNYEVNDGKGAVDLSWSQSDQNNKTYLVYQKKRTERGSGSTVQMTSAARQSLIRHIRLTDKQSNILYRIQVSIL